MNFLAGAHWEGDHPAHGRRGEQHQCVNYPLNTKLALTTSIAVLFKGANYATLPGIPKLHPETTHILLQNEIPFAETIAYLSLAHSFASESEKPISTVFNPSPMPSDAQLKSFPWDKLTWLIVNEGEASDLSRVLANEDGVVHPVEGNTEGELGAAKRLLQKLSQQIPHTHVVCTLGAKGVLALLRPGNAVSDEGSAPDAPDGRGRIQDPIYLPAATLECVTDTTGAGDCFAGYLVAGLMSLGTGHEELSKDDVVNVLRRCVQVCNYFSRPAFSMTDETLLCEGGGAVC